MSISAPVEEPYLKISLKREKRDLIVRMSRHGLRAGSMSTSGIRVPVPLYDDQMDLQYAMGGSILNVDARVEFSIYDECHSLADALAHCSSTYTCARTALVLV